MALAFRALMCCTVPGSCCAHNRARALAEHSRRLTSAPPQAPLPDGWKEELDPNTNEPYYFNYNSGESSWEHPADEIYRRRAAAEMARHDGGAAAAPGSVREPSSPARAASVVSEVNEIDEEISGALSCSRSDISFGGGGDQYSDDFDEDSGDEARGEGEPAAQDASSSAVVDPVDGLGRVVSTAAAATPVASTAPSSPAVDPVDSPGPALTAAAAATPTSSDVCLTAQVAPKSAATTPEPVPKSTAPSPAAAAPAVAAARSPPVETLSADAGLQKETVLGGASEEIASTAQAVDAAIAQHHAHLANRVAERKKALDLEHSRVLSRMKEQQSQRLAVAQNDSAQEAEEALKEHAARVTAKLNADKAAAEADAEATHSVALAEFRAGLQQTFARERAKAEAMHAEALAHTQQALADELAEAKRQAAQKRDQAVAQVEEAHSCALAQRAQELDKRLAEAREAAAARVAAVHASAGVQVAEAEFEVADAGAEAGAEIGRRQRLAAARVMEECRVLDEQAQQAIDEHVAQLQASAEARTKAANDARLADEAAAAEATEARAAERRSLEAEHHRTVTELREATERAVEAEHQRLQDEVAAVRAAALAELTTGVEPGTDSNPGVAAIEVVKLRTQILELERRGDDERAAVLSARAEADAARTATHAAQAQVTRLEGQLATAAASHAEELRVRDQRRVTELAAAHKNFEGQLATVDAKVCSAGNEGREANERLAAVRAEHQAALDKLAEFERRAAAPEAPALAALESDLGGPVDAKANVLRQHDERLVEMRDAFDARVADVARAHEDRLQALADNFEAAKANAKELHVAQLDELEASLASRLQQVREEHQAQLEEAVSVLQQDRENEVTRARRTLEAEGAPLSVARALGEAEVREWLEQRRREGLLELEADLERRRAAFTAEQAALDAEAREARAERAQSSLDDIKGDLEEAVRAKRRQVDAQVQLEIERHRIEAAAELDRAVASSKAEADERLRKVRDEYDAELARLTEEHTAALQQHKKRPTDAEGAPAMRPMDELRAELVEQLEQTRLRDAAAHLDQVKQLQCDLQRQASRPEGRAGTVPTVRPAWPVADPLQEYAARTEQLLRRADLLLADAPTVAPPLTLPHRSRAYRPLEPHRLLAPAPPQETVESHTRWLRTFRSSLIADGLLGPAQGAF